MTAELCPTCGIWWRGVEHSCRLPVSSTTTDFDPAWGAISKAEVQRLRKIEEAARAHIAWEYRARGAPRFTLTALRAALEVKS